VTILYNVSYINTLLSTHSHDIEALKCKKLNRQKRKIYKTYTQMKTNEQNLLISMSFHTNIINFGLPLNASTNCSRVLREIPLYPFAKTLILRARSIRVFSGGSGSPTPAAWDRMRFSWSSLRTLGNAKIAVKIRVYHSSSIAYICGFGLLFC
jgi:hypothetical protein